MCDEQTPNGERYTSRHVNRRDVVRAGLGAAMLAALPGPLRAAHVRAEPDSRYLDAAIRAGKWIRATAVVQPNGTTWPAVPPDAKTVQGDLYSGSPGVVLFLLELYRATGDRAWLELATAGADHLAASLPDRATGDDGAGLYSGLAGVAYTLDETSRVSDRPAYRTAARKALGLITASAKSVGEGVEWSDTTDIISGTAGIGLTLLWLSAAQQDAGAHALAIRAGRRLVEREYRTGDASLWMMSPSFTRNMPNFSHGTAGVAYFLATLAGDTKDARFRDAAVRGARYLQSVATPTDGDGQRIFHNDPDGRELYYLSWCHGPAGTARLFHRLGGVTGDKTWSSYVPKLAQGTIASGVPKQSAGFWNNISQCCGNCGVSDFFVSLHGLTRSDAYLAFARTCADDVLARATPEGDGLKWVQAENRVSPNVVLAQTGLMQGAAGVGLSMLRLDGALRGRKPTIVLPDNPFV
ncbi:MAG TPA: lanthionine synthetase LanC family protein [Gemmatimonadaceae bacterium]|nr:lanthionine synthetase LanC family protein [Gemmatimonadaceae bacterium]